RAVVGNDADGMAHHFGLDADGRDAVGWLEVGEVGAVDDAGNDFTRIIGRAVVNRHDTGDLVGVERRFAEAARRRGGAVAVPAKTADDLASDQAGFRVVLRKIFGKTRHRRMHVGPAEFLFGGDLA